MMRSSYLAEPLSSADCSFNEMLSSRLTGWYVNERALKEAVKDSLKVLFQRL